MDGVAGTDLVSQAIADLYSGDLDAFIQRRRDLVAQARSAGDRAAAKTIAGLGKPTRSAWVVNKLVHADPSVSGRLAELGDRLRAGEAALDGASIRELSRARRELVDALTRRALTEAGQASPSAAIREEVTDTLSAALADPQVAEQVAAGTLLRAAHWAGFGPGIGTAIDTAQAPAPSARRRPADGAGRGRTVDRAEAAERDEAAERAERERHRQEAIANAEQVAAEAGQVADAAAAAERQIAESVQFMQERLSREQQRLIEARRDTRQAAAALARARQALERRRRQSSS